MAPQTGLGTLGQGLGWHALGEGRRRDTSARRVRMCLLKDEKCFIKTWRELGIWGRRNNSRFRRKFLRVGLTGTATLTPFWKTERGCLWGSSHSSEGQQYCPGPAPLPTSARGGTHPGALPASPQTSYPLLFLL